MHSKKSLKKQIVEIGLKPSDSVLIHSSMKAIGEVEGGAETVLDVLIERFSTEGLLMFPTHSWKDWSTPNNIFDPEKEPSCVGILSELFRTRPGVRRSLHPTHSIAAIGARAEKFLKGEENTRSPAPKDGCWGRLYDLEAKILFIGATLKTNTFLHSVEEWHDIPDRLASNPTHFKIRMPGGALLDCPQYRHDSPFGDVSQNYDKIEATLFEQGIAISGAIGSAKSVCCAAAPMADFVSKKLRANPNLFDDGRPF